MGFPPLDLLFPPPPPEIWHNNVNRYYKPSAYQLTFNSYCCNLAWVKVLVVKAPSNLGSLPHTMFVISVISGKIMH